MRSRSLRAVMIMALATGLLAMGAPAAFAQNPVEGNCGTATITLRETLVGVEPGLDIELDVELKPPFETPLQGSASGYFINQTTQEFAPLVGGMTTYPYAALATWEDVNTGQGTVEVSFPVVEIISTGGICFGLFPRSTVYVGDDLGAFGASRLAPGETREITVPLESSAG